jgi:hypothetical protein
MSVLNRPAAPPAITCNRLRRLLFAIGLALSAWMVARSQIGGDQLNLLARGWLLIEQGQWVPYGNPTSSGGAQPGGLTSLLVALPLLLWRDHRAASALVLLMHVGGYLLLDRTLARALTPWGRVLFAVCYWLNPWRLYHSAFLWNPNWLFLPAAVHLWSAWAQRAEARFGASFAHVLALGLAIQLHASFVLLLFASAFLLLRRRMRLHWPGAVLAGAVSAAALVPWALSAAGDAGSLPVQEGFLGRGLLLVQPMLKGLLYWPRYASLSLSKRVASFDFAPALGSAVDAWLDPLVSGLTVLLGVTLLVPLAANWRLLRRRWRAFRGGLRHVAAGPAPAASARGWVASYARCCFAAAVVTFALAPTTIMMWQGFLVLHAAVLPVVLWGEALARSRRGRVAVAAAGVWAAVSVVWLALMAVGSPHYRNGGEEPLQLTLRHDHPMLRELGIQETAPMPIRPDGWWPDVLPEPDGAVRGAGRSGR